MIFLIIFLTIILGILIWGGVTQWKFIGKSEKNNDVKNTFLRIAPTGFRRALHSLILQFISQIHKWDNIFIRKGMNLRNEL